MTSKGVDPAVPSEVQHSHVFVSYASADRDRVLCIAAVLEARGIPLWLDRRSITGGRRWTAEIVRGVEDCAALLVMCTPASVASRNVQQEVQLAWESGRPMLPLLIEEVQMPAELRYALAGQQWVEVRDRPEGEWLPELVGALSALGVLGETGSPSLGSAKEAQQVKQEKAALSGTELGRRPILSLPVPRNRFIGRESETRAIIEALKAHRAITLTGPGGVGKSRLASEVAWRVADDYPDGLWLVPLETATGPDQPAQRVAESIEVLDVPGRPLLQQITHRLTGVQALLILDNCERSVEPCAELVAALTMASRGLRVLATSREMLGTVGEFLLEVPPLAVPDTEVTHSPQQLMSSESVQLFRDRARSIFPEFEIDGRNASAVAGICRELDGIPLGIELAAARIRTLTPQEILSRMTHAYAFLHSTDRLAHPRQRTLEATVEWSHDGLIAEEQVLWRRLSVFPETFGLEAVESVCGFAPLGSGGLIDLLAALVDKSMVQVSRGGPETRYRLLKTLHSYAEAKLREAGERALLEERHMDWCRRVIEANNQERISQEYPDIRAALERILATSDRGAEVLELVGRASMWRALVDLHPSDGLQILTAALAQAPDDPSCARAWVLGALGKLLHVADQYLESREYAGAALDLAREYEQHELVVRCLNYLALREVSLAGEQGRDQSVAIEMFEEAIRYARANGTAEFLTGQLEDNLAFAYLCNADIRQARRTLIGDSGKAAVRSSWTHTLLSLCALAEGNLQEAAAHADSAVESGQAEGIRRLLAYALAVRANVLVVQGDLEQGAGVLLEGLRIQLREGLTWYGLSLPPCVRLLILQGDARSAVTILASYQAATGAFPYHPDLNPSRLLELARDRLTPAEFESCWAAGKAMSPGQLAETILGSLRPPPVHGR